MHEESWEIGQSTLDAIQDAKKTGRPIIAVGTTSVRTLESLPPIADWPENGGLSGKTRLMISPPYEFKVVDGMLTNFHLPKSTLLTLVAAMIGIERLKLAYAEAIDSEYRFYSYGDAMFFLSQDEEM
jgi:S-adenosylmethionine:tRNA ribosyltransferase-isomerase